MSKGLTVRIDAEETIYSANSAITNVSLLNILRFLEMLEKPAS